jgi:HSP20 family protein
MIIRLNKPEVKAGNSNTLFHMPDLFDSFVNPYVSTKRLVSDFFPDERFGKRAVPAVNIYENSESIKLDLLAPGIMRNEITVKIEENQLLISYQAKIQENEKKEDSTNETLVKQEFTIGSFERRFVLPKNVDKDTISAVYENGVLKIVLKKMEEVKEVKTVDVL